MGWCRSFTSVAVFFLRLAFSRCSVLSKVVRNPSDGFVALGFGTAQPEYEASGKSASLSQALCKSASVPLSALIGLGPSGGHPVQFEL